MSDELHPPLTEAEEKALTLFRLAENEWAFSSGKDSSAVELKGQKAQDTAVRLIRAAERERVLRECENVVRDISNCIDPREHPAWGIKDAADAIAALRGAPEEGTDGE